jgi:phosphatidylglycerophosphatase A
VAPGTFGAAVGVVLFLLLRDLGPWLFSLTTLALLSVGVWASDEAERGFRRKDDGRIVIDEVVGQLLALAPLVWLGAPARPLWLVTGFVAFRGFDVWKPGPARWAERRFEGGAGVMLDDVAAGLFAAAVVAAGLLVVGA